MPRALLFFLLALLLPNLAKADEPRKPNVVFILADDLGWADTTLYGHTQLYQTPNIERLAERGMTFTRAYAASPLCSPTRSAILTGLSPARTGLTTPNCHLPQVVLTAKPGAAAPPNQQAIQPTPVTRLKTEYWTLAETLHDAGYATGHFGKWHLGHEPYSPLEHGFEVDVPHHPGPGPAGSYVAPWKFKDFDHDPDVPDQHIEDRMAQEAVAWMEKHQDRPFFLNYWMFSVHAPFDAKQSLIEKYRPLVKADDPQRSPTYAAMIESMDDAIGTLLDTLDRLEIADDTIIVFTSDNGGNMYNEVDGTTPTSNAPLRGGKACMFDGGTRVPCVIAWPGNVEPNTRNDSLVQSEDFYPTLLEALDLQAEVGQRFDGVSLIPAMKGEKLQRSAVFQYFPHAPPVPDWIPPSVSVHTDDWKLIRIFHGGEKGEHRYKLFDLKEDIGERHDLSADRPEVVKQLDRLIDDFLADTKAVVPRPNPKFDPAKFDPKAEGKPRIRNAPKRSAKPVPPRQSIAQADDAKSRRPNIIVVFTDDHGWADLGAQGIEKDIRTPHIDALAEGGLRATNGYVTAPQCVPSRGGLLTGRYQNRFGLESNGLPLEGFNAERTIAERLQAAGYATGMAGKWHLGPTEQIADHGFDKVFHKHSNGPGFWNMDLEGNEIEPSRQTGGGYHLDMASEFACAFIERHRQEPFFFYLAYRAPHVPLDAPAKYLDRFPGEMPERRRQCLAMMSAVDDGVGRVVETLRKHKLEENTLIFVMGDNGAPLKIHKLDAPGGGPGWDGSLNKPMNGEKGMLSEGGIRVPWVAHWKGTIPPGQTYHEPVISLDVAATAAALAGIDPEGLDGANLIPHFTGQTKAAPHEALYWRWIAQAAIREGKWKYLRGGAREYLFDLDADKEELRNLVAEHPEIAKQMQAKLAKWAGTLDPPGIETGKMSVTWERYFDHYLDGKPQAVSKAPERTPNSIQGWIVRNGTMKVTGGTLLVEQKETGKQTPFLACAKLSLAAAESATVELRSEKGGKGAIAWRLEGQKDFQADQSIDFDVDASTDWQTITTKLPATGKIIHVRLLLPAGVTSIRRVEIDGANKQSSRQWMFER